jgi:hypothetical protein
VRRQQAKLRRLARAAQCTVPPPLPPPPPPPPAAPPPPPALPVNAAFVVGAGVPAEQLALARRSLELANGFFKVRFGRELTPFTVDVFADLEGIAAAYAEKTRNPIERARQLWSTGTSAVAQSGGIFVYLGSQGWTQSSETARVKIVAHEAFHLLQGDLAGSARLNSGETDVPLAGPRWLTEGSAEYFAYRVVAENRLVDFEATRARWISVVKTMSVPLSSLEVATGLRGVSGVYDLTPLAASRLVESVGEGAFIAYWEAVGRGTPWQTAFAAAFGRTVQAFYEEFEAYRRGL